MGTYTAQILVGRAHPFDGGITPTHQLFLSENSRPAWVLTELGGDPGRRAVWIPTVERVLEDGLVMAGALVLQDPELLGALGDARRVPGPCLYDLPEAIRDALYARCRAFRPPAKLVVCAFGGSTILGQLPRLAEFAWKLEVLAPAGGSGAGGLEG